MRGKRIQSQVNTGRWTLHVTVLICVFCWLLTYFLLPESTLLMGENETYFLHLFALRLSIPYWMAQAVGFLIYAATGYFLIGLNNRFVIIRTRASIQTSVYFLLVTACPAIYPLCVGNVAALACVASVYFLFKSYQNAQAIYLFYSFLFIGIGSILFPQLTFFIPLWMIEAYRFQSLTLRSFCGALLGWMLPYWLLFAHAFFYDQMELFYAPFIQLATFGEVFRLDMLQLCEWITIVYLFVLTTVSSVHCVMTEFNDKISTRTYLRFFIDLSIFLLLLIVLQPIHCGILLPFLMISCGILIGHFFMLSNSKASNRFFLAALIGLIFLFGFNLWTLL